jgi:hypothetical protein
MRELVSEEAQNLLANLLVEEVLVPEVAATVTVDTKATNMAMRSDESDAWESLHKATSGVQLSRPF